MKYGCIHTHTLFCDGNSDVETNCRAAYEKGLNCLGFSSHAPIRKKIEKTGWVIKEELLNDFLSEGDLGQYIDEVNAAKLRWEGKLKVFLGLEADFISGITGPSDSDFAKMGLDYIIGSVHFIIPPKGNPFTVDSPLAELERGIREGFDGDPQAMVDFYYDALAALVGQKGFDVLGHPDLLKKHNANNRFFDEDSAQYKKRCEEIAALAEKNKVTVEVNTGGMNRKYIKSPYPSGNFLKSFREHNVPAVINADAHKPEDLDGYYAEAVAAMLAAGYTEMVLFEGKKNGLPVWTKVKL